jgi:hypothetical protein
VARPKTATPIVTPHVTPVPASPFHTPAEVCAILRCSKRTLIRMYKGCKKKDGAFVRPVLAAVRRGGSILISKYELERYIAARSTVAA